MIAIRLMGGLGNMLFQIATGESWRKDGYDIAYTNMDANLDFIAKNYTPKRNSDVYELLFENFNWDMQRSPIESKFRPQYVPFVYSEIVPKDGTEYIGYFQSEKNFPDKDYIRWLFEPSEWTREQLLFPFGGQVTCSMHVRRQDYLRLSDYHTNLGIDYYEKAIWTLEPFNIDKILIYSDDIEWCKGVFIGERFLFMDTVEYLTLFQMGMCDHHIIANSSLSWWGAWLREDQDKVIIYPKNWFGIKGEDSRDVCPQRWIYV